MLQNPDILSEGAGCVGVGDSKGGDERGTEGGGEVHAAAVVTEGEGGEGENRGQFLHGGFTSEIQSVGGGGGGHLVAGTFRSLGVPSVIVDPPVWATSAAAVSA